MHILVANMSKKKMNIYRHGPRLSVMPNNCQNLDTHNFSLPTTFKIIFNIFFLLVFLDTIMLAPAACCYVTVTVMWKI
jgi:hypothetical protein